MTTFANGHWANVVSAQLFSPSIVSLCLRCCTLMLFQELHDLAEL